MNQIKYYRKKKGMTQTDLARRSGVPFATLRRYENETRIMPDRTAEKLASALGVTMKQLCPENKLERVCTGLLKDNEPNLDGTDRYGEGYRDAILDIMKTYNIPLM